jgi:hypothetical protein
MERQMTATPLFTFDQLAACAEREVKFRRRVYARRVQLNKMKQADADREIALMEAIRDYFRNQATVDDLFGRCG